MKVFILHLLIVILLHCLIFFPYNSQKKVSQIYSSTRVVLVNSEPAKSLSKKPTTSTKTQTETQTDSDSDSDSDPVSDTDSQNTPQTDHPINPIYPAFSRLKGEEGENLLRFKIDSQGRAQEIEIAESSGFKRLDRASEEAIQKALFHANKIDKIFELRFKFVLNLEREQR